MQLEAAFSDAAESAHQAGAEPREWSAQICYAPGHRT